MIKLFVFLGNPGKDYTKTRHNAGFLLADDMFPYTRWSSKFHSLYAEENGKKLLKPLTYMNLSGTAVSECATFFKIKPEEIIVIHDDLELPLGEVRIQKGGGLQGHNGLRNIKERIGSDQFYRLRIGIGRPKFGDVRLFVTSPFSKEEEIHLSQVFTVARRMLNTPDKEGSEKL
jgi:PTH1 family peptidyl-tRNA hydrolase